MANPLCKQIAFGGQFGRTAPWPGGDLELNEAGYSFAPVRIPVHSPAKSVNKLDANVSFILLGAYRKYLNCRVMFQGEYDLWDTMTSGQGQTDVERDIPP